MTKQELINEIQAVTGDEKQKIEAFIDVFTRKVMTSTASGNAVTIRGFGTFGLVQRKAKVGRNIKKGEPINIPAKKVMRFNPSKYFEQRVDKLQNNLQN